MAETIAIYVTYKELTDALKDCSPFIGDKFAAIIPPRTFDGPRVILHITDIPKPSTCVHANWIIEGNTSAGKCRCTDCGIEFPVWVAFNRLHDRMLEALERVNKMTETIGNIPKAAPKIKGQQKKQKAKRKAKG